MVICHVAHVLCGGIKKQHLWQSIYPKKKREERKALSHMPPLWWMLRLCNMVTIYCWRFYFVGNFFLSSLHTLFRQSRDVRGDMLLRVKRSVIGNMQEGGDSSKKMERLVGDSLTNRLNISLISSESPARMKEDLLCGTWTDRTGNKGGNKTN